MNYGVDCQLVIREGKIQGVRSRTRSAGPVERAPARRHFPVGMGCDCRGRRREAGDDYRRLPCGATVCDGCAEAYDRAPIIKHMDDPLRALQWLMAVRD